MSDPYPQHIQRGRNRAAAIAVARGHILLMRRQRPGRGVYYVFPGGGVEPGERRRDAVRRELQEETGLRARVVRTVFVNTTPSGGRQEYFLVQTSFFPVALPKHAPERSPQYQRERGTARPVWVPVNKLRRLRLFPQEVKHALLRSLEKGFARKPKDLGVIGF